MWFEYHNMATNFRQTRWNEKIMAQIPFQQKFKKNINFLKHNYLNENT